MTMMNDTRRKRVIVEVPILMHVAVKKKCASLGVSVRAVVNDLLKAWLRGGKG